MADAEGSSAPTDGDLREARGRFLKARRQSSSSVKRKRKQTSDRKVAAEGGAADAGASPAVAAKTLSRMGLDPETQAMAAGIVAAAFRARGIADAPTDVDQAQGDGENPKAAGRPAQAESTKVRSDYRTHIGEMRQRSAIAGGGSYPAANGGRPPVWTEETIAPWAKLLLVHLSEGKSLKAFVALNPEGPSIATWLDYRANSPMFSDLYTRARENGADALADEICDIADGVADAGREDSAKVNAARLRVDARKWVAAKLKPKSYADRTEQGLEVRVSGSITHELTDRERARALDALLRRQAVAGAASLTDAMARLAGPLVDVTPDRTTTVTRDAVTKGKDD